MVGNSRTINRSWRYSPVKIRSSYSESLIHWPIVGAAGAVAFSFVSVLIVTAWAASLPAQGGRQVLAPTEMPGVPDCQTSSRADSSSSSLSPMPASAKGRNPGAAASQSVLPIQLSEPSPNSEIAKPAIIPGPGSAPLGACKVQTGSPRETCGTTVEFARDPTEAALRAKRERKLMFVLHVSGNFEESKFT
jgi:hypothetical protein